MNFNRLHRFFASIVFLASFIVFALTVAPTLSFWDCGEFITAAYTLGVPHPPGAPFFELLGKAFTFLPVGGHIADAIGFRVNLISVLSSALTVLFVYLTLIRLFRSWHGDPEGIREGLIMILAGMTGAFALAFSDTFWFNAAEAEVYGIGMFFISFVVWLTLEWYTRSGVFNSDRTLLLIAYLLGLSIGVHLLSLLAIFFVFVLYYFRDRVEEYITWKTGVVFALGALGVFAVVYPGVVKYLPSFLEGNTVILVFIIIFGLVAIVAYAKKAPRAQLLSLATLLIILGYSTYALIIIRANKEPALNENAPTSLEYLVKYLNREQYGDYPILRGPTYDNRLGTIDVNRKVLFPRRWSMEPKHIREYQKYSSDLDFFLRFQLGHIYLRYFMWNFVGRAGDLQDAPVVLFEDAGNWSDSPGYPSRYFAIPLLLGLFGLYLHWKKDWKTSLAMTLLFMATGIGLVVYFNMSAPQVRERDYFFVGSFYVFAIWIGVGAYGLMELLRKWLKEREAASTVSLAGGLALLVLAPGNMLLQNYQTHNRSLNYVAFDYAYNLLQSCEKDAILFTGGDNDTFPVWYLQYVAGIRRDVRVANLSLLNTDWYMLQLKNETPYGAKKVPISYTDEQIRHMEVGEFDKREIRIPVPADIYRESIFKDVVRGMTIPDSAGEVVFTMQSAITDAYGRKLIRNQDRMVLDIIVNAKWKRPIHFALTTMPSDKIGLDNYLIVRGLTYQLVPYRMETRQDRYYSNVDLPTTMKHLLNPVSIPDSARSYGFMFRQLQNPKVNLDEQSTRMILSYRYLFMACAQVYLQDGRDTAGALRVLDQMEKLLPRRIHRMDPILKTDLAMLYYLCNRDDKFVEYTREVEPYYLDLLAQDPTGQSSPRNPYTMLLSLYELEGEWQKGIDILKRYKQYVPNDPSVDQRIREWMSKLNQTSDTVARVP